MFRRKLRLDDVGIEPSKKMWIIYGYYSVLPSQNWENEDCMVQNGSNMFKYTLWFFDISLNIAHFEWKLLETHLPTPYIYYLYMGGSTNGDCMIQNMWPGADDGVYHDPKYPPFER